MARRKTTIKKTKATVAKSNPNPIRRGRRRANFRIPVALVAGFVPPVIITAAVTKRHGLKWGLIVLFAILTGWDIIGGRWEPRLMKFGLLPIALGLGIHYYLGQRGGINRKLSRIGIPILRV